MGQLVLLLLGIGAIVLYFTPSIRANSVQHPDTVLIFILNLFLGWLLIPWVIALVWSYKEARQSSVSTPAPSIDDLMAQQRAMQAPQVRVAPTTKLCPFCAEEVKIEAIKCKHCQSDLTAKSQG